MAGEEELSSAGSLPPHLDLPHLCPLCQRRVAKVNSLTNPEPSAQCPYRDFAALLRCFFFAALPRCFFAALPRSFFAALPRSFFSPATLFFLHKQPQMHPCCSGKKHRTNLS